MPKAIAPDQQEKMLSGARAAFQNAHAPYSKFKAGSHHPTERGVLYSGCNVENASYGLTICAERNAIFAAVAAEGSSMRIKAVAVATEQEVACAPLRRLPPGHLRIRSGCCDSLSRPVRYRADGDHATAAGGLSLVIGQPASGVPARLFFAAR